MHTKRILFAAVLGCLVLPASLAQTAIQYTTTGDRSRSFAVSQVQGEATTVEEGSIRLNVDETYQTMEGFGFAMTYSACYNLLQMSPESRRELLTRTFSPTQGYGASYIRISIGCSDFSSTEYSLCDIKGPDHDLLRHFRLYKDETDYVIPVLKEILAINPDLKIMGSPWTCPRWMKVDSPTSLQPHDAWTDGHLSPAYYRTYADYFVRFIQAFQSEGIPIYSVTPQNEPLNPGNCASLVMNWNEEAAFVKQMAGAIQRAGLTTKIYVFDHNYNYDGIASQQQYPVKIYDLLADKDFAGKELIAGAAYHNYGGSTDELIRIHQSYPDKELIFTEASIGTWNHGRDLDTSLADIAQNVALQTVNKWCTGVIVWNFMLDMNRGPNLDGGCQTCFGAVDVAGDYQSYTLNSHYYALCHLSAVVRPGAVRIAGGGWNMQGVTYATFRNPDGTLAVVLYNSLSTPLSLHVTDNSVRYPLAVPPRSMVSLLMDNSATYVPARHADIHANEGSGTPAPQSMPTKVHNRKGKKFRSVGAKRKQP